MAQKRFILLFVGVVFSLLLVNATTFVVRGVEQAVVVRFGRIVQVIQSEPGLYFKWPIIEYVEKFDKRIIIQEIGPLRVPAKENKFIFISSVAHWRIKDPGKFLQSARTEENGALILEQILNATIRDQVSRHTISEVAAGRSAIQSCSGLSQGQEPDTLCTRGQGTVIAELEQQASDYGVDLLGLETLRITPNVRQDVESRMIAERQSAADQLRSEGQSISTQILGGINFDVEKIISEARRRADEVRIKTEGSVYGMYAKAYETAPEFYSFFKTLDSYKSAINSNTTLMLRADSKFYGLLEAK
jgi:modulator of FtsH protease HflC